MLSPRHQFQLAHSSVSRENQLNTFHILRCKKSRFSQTLDYKSAVIKNCKYRYHSSNRTTHIDCLSINAAVGCDWASNTDRAKFKQKKSIYSQSQRYSGKRNSHVFSNHFNYSFFLHCVVLDFDFNLYLFFSSIVYSSLCFIKLVLSCSCFRRQMNMLKTVEWYFFLHILTAPVELREKKCGDFCGTHDTLKSIHIACLGDQ